MISKGSINILKFIFQISISILLLAYFLWEVYWYNKVGIGFINWHTHLMLYVYLILLFYLFQRTIKKTFFKNLSLLTLSVLVLFFSIEFFLILKGTYTTYHERIYGHYYSFYNSIRASFYHTWPSNALHYMQTPEYKFIRKTNSLGFSDKEWIPQKNTKTRILAIGDSFTEGDGAPPDSCFVSLLSKILNTDSSYFEFMNAGTCGSDPFFNFINYQDRLQNYQPDIILQSLSAGDVLTDMTTRGGIERFKNDSFLTFNKAPWWEPFYAISHVSRIFFSALGYNEFLQKGDLTDENKKKFDVKLIELFERYDSLATINNASLFVIIRPDGKSEVTSEMASYDFSSITNTLSKTTRIHFVNLIPLYKQYFKEKGENINDYYWKQDGHHNSKGYSLMAQLIAESVFGKKAISNKSN
jgi:lysophospholipase L1-like esterase